MTCKVRVSKLDAHKKQIDGWLEGNKRERKKQRQEATTILNQLVEEQPNFDCSCPLVASYAAKKKRELYGGRSEFYMPLEHMPVEA